MRGREGGEGENSEDIRGTLEEAVKSKAARSKGRGTGSEKVVDPTYHPLVPLPPSPAFRGREGCAESQRWKQTSWNYECKFSKGERKVDGPGWWRERMGASSRRYYTANVNMAADVFRKARISPPRLLILVIGATYTPDALNVRKARQEAEPVKSEGGRDEWFPA